MGRKRLPKFEQLKNPKVKVFEVTSNNDLLRLYLIKNLYEELTGVLSNKDF